MIKLTDEQRSAVESGDPVRVMAPELGREIVVVRADLYDIVSELLQEESDREVIAGIAVRNAMARLEEAP
jgi:hypothetical protein